MKFAVVKIDQEKCELTVSLNGVPIYRQNGDGNTQAFVNEWLTTADNTIAIRVGWPKGVSFIANAAAARVGVFEVSAGERLSESSPLFEFTWPGKRRESYPFVQTASVAFTNRVETSLGRRTKVIQEVTTSDREAFYSRLQLLRTAIERKDWAAMTTILALKYSDLDSAYGQTAGATQTTATDALQSAAGLGAWTLENFALADLFPEIVAGGHLIAATRLNGDSLIRTSAAAATHWELPVFFGKIDGNWVILR